MTLAYSATFLWYESLYEGLCCLKLTLKMVQHQNWALNNTRNATARGTRYTASADCDCISRQKLNSVSKF
eukprot:6910-Heterococcus_DN1.PRE.1